MKLKGLTNITKSISNLQEVVEEKINEIDWDKKDADEKDEKLNDVWMELDTALDSLNGIKDI